MRDSLWMAGGCVVAAGVAVWRGRPLGWDEMLAVACGLTVGALLHGGLDWLRSRYRIRVERREVAP